MKARGALLLLALVGCSTETTRVREARDEFYGAISRYDQGAIRALVAGDYLAVDRGRLFNLDSLLSDVFMLEQESLAVKYAFADSAIRVDPPLAVVVYHSRRIAARAHSSDTAFAVESATFRRDGGGWKLVVLHRTPIAAAPEYFPGPATRVAAPAKGPPVTTPAAAVAPRPAAPRPNPPAAQPNPVQAPPATQTPATTTQPPPTTTQIPVPGQTDPPAPQ